MDDQPAIGWYRDPAGSHRFRYWNGAEWTARATTEVRPGGHITTASGRRRHRPLLDSWLVSNTVVFHALAWFDCSVPLARGRLRRFMEPVEMRTMDQIRAMQADSGS